MEKERKILIVDDEPNIVMTLEYLMRKNGYGVFIARNGTEALGILENETPDLVLLDIMMPDVDGYAICQWIKSKERLDGTKIFFVSAKSKQSDIDKGLELGADRYISKPFSTRKLMKEVREVLTVDT